VENSIEGTVGLSLDYLKNFPNLYIIGEVVLPIRHCIAVKNMKNFDFTEIKYIYSHSQALGQCREFLEINFPGCELRQTSSTAEAASIVASGLSGQAAAICSPFAAEKYGLTIIASDIQDYPNNKTRFFVVEKKPLKFLNDKGPGKTSMVFSLPEDSPGSLYMVLKYFAEEKINLTKIESRPAKKELGHYFSIWIVRGMLGKSPLLP